MGGVAPADVRAILTGGLSAAPWAQALPGVDAIDPDLTLKGLAILHAEVVARRATRAGPAVTGRLEGRLIGLGVTGSIAAYKAVELLRLLRSEGADVSVMLSPSATRFVGAALVRGSVAPPGRDRTARPAARRADRPHRPRRYGRRDRGRTGDRALAGCDGQRPGRRRHHGHLSRDRGAGRRRPGDGWRDVDAPGDRDERGAASGRLRLSDRRAGAGPLASGQSGVGRLAELDAIVDAVVEAVADRPIRAPDPAARPPLVGPGSGRGPRWPTHRRHGRRHARADRPGPLHRQSLDREDGRGPRAGRRWIAGRA